VQLLLLLLEQAPQHVALLVQAREVLLVYIAHLECFDEGHEYPECDLLAAVVENAAYDEVHALHVADALVVLRVCEEHALQAAQALLVFELRAPRKGPRQVLHYLVLIVAEQLEFCQLLICLSHLL
jgi:hypothetical protein